MFEAGVDDLLHPEHLTAENIPGIVDVAIRVCKSRIDRLREVAKTLIVDEDSD